MTMKPEQTPAERIEAALRVANCLRAGKPAFYKDDPEPRVSAPLSAVVAALNGLLVSPPSEEQIEAEATDRWGEFSHTDSRQGAFERDAFVEGAEWVVANLTATGVAPQEQKQRPDEYDDEFIERMKRERPDLSLEDLGFVEVPAPGEHDWDSLDNCRKCGRAFVGNRENMIQGDCPDPAPALDREQREKLHRVIHAVLWNASNYPPPVRPHLLGEDITPLTAKVVEAVTALAAVPAVDEAKDDYPDPEAKAWLRGEQA